MLYIPKGVYEKYSLGHIGLIWVLLEREKKKRNKIVI
jgi:hypothetical protein